jgi:hypothetical protein
VVATPRRAARHRVTRIDFSAMTAQTVATTRMFVSTARGHRAEI